jgi:hypothetical protein
MTVAVTKEMRGRMRVVVVKGASIIGTRGSAVTAMMGCILCCWG